MRLAVLAGLGLAAVPAAALAQNAGPPWCPAVGMTLKSVDLLNRETTITEQGPSAADPATCVLIPKGPNAGANYGKPVLRLMGWYDLTDYTFTPGSIARARAALQSVLSGQSQTATVKVTLGRVGTASTWSNEETWTRVGAATLPINGTPQPVMALRWVSIGTASSHHHESWDVFYDPSRHVFVKADEHVNGAPVSYGFRVVSASP